MAVQPLPALGVATVLKRNSPKMKVTGAVVETVGAPVAAPSGRLVLPSNGALVLAPLTPKAQSVTKEADDPKLTVMVSEGSAAGATAYHSLI